MSFNTTFSPRENSPAEFITRIKQTLSRRDIFLIPITNKLGYWTTIFPLKDNTPCWCYTIDQKVAIILDKHLLFQPQGSSDLVCTKDGKTFRQVDDFRMMKFYKGLCTQNPQPRAPPPSLRSRSCGEVISTRDYL